jgi:hypothetical protein
MRIERRRRVCVRWTGIILLALVMVLGLAAGALAFTDVQGNPYATAINELASHQIVNGFGDLFKPNDPVKRQQFAKMIVLTLGLEVPSDAVCRFTDVDTTPNVNDPLYPAKYVEVCASNLITTGKTPTTFDPAGSITRQQLITMVARAADLPDPPAGYLPTSGFGQGQFSLSDHYLNACKADAAGLLAGLQGVGPTYDFTAASNRGECAQLLYNLLQSQSSLLPRYADLQPTGQVGYDFQIHYDPFRGVEEGPTLPDDWWDDYPAGAISGHLKIEIVSVQGANVTVKFVLDRLDLPASMSDSQAGFDEMLPVSLRFKTDAQGGISSVFVSAVEQPEDEIQADFVDVVSTMLAPVVRAILTPYSGQLAAPGDSVHTQDSPTRNGHKLMDVASQMDFTSIAGDIARLDWNLDITNIDIPLEVDAKPIMPLFGYTQTNFGTPEWMLQMTLGSEILAEGTYDLDVTTGLPKAMALGMNMMLDVSDVTVPPEFRQLQPNSHFFKGDVTHAYVHPMKVQFTLTQD